MTELHQLDFALEPADGERLANLAGPFDEHLRQIELRLGITIANRGNVFRLGGDAAATRLGERVLRELYAATENETLGGAQVNLALSGSGADALEERAADAQDVAIKTKRGTVRGRGANQQRYLHAIATHDINFGIGPAGTGKTYLAVAMAVDALNDSRVQRLILVRPAVEAGEKLGFLPGDLTQKVDPYLRPLYDAFVILDEAQNTTIEQMKMFLTRIGFGSVAVVTGDMTQTDLPRHVKSGLRDAIEVLREVDGVSFTFFTAKDVVRHPLVQRIVRAYETRDATAPKREPAA